MSKIFVSHRESDQSIADLLVDSLLAAIAVADTDVRCTSVAGHQLPFGTAISERLGEDLRNTEALIAILTKDSLASTWVLFELGASWAMGKLVVPILGPGLSFSDIPGPLAGYPGIRIEAEDAPIRYSDALAQIATRLQIATRSGGKSGDKQRKFVEAFRSYRPLRSPADAHPPAGKSNKSEAEELIKSFLRASGDPHDYDYIAPALLRARRLGRAIGADATFFRAIDTLVGDIDEMRTSVTYPAPAHLSVNDVEAVVNALEQFVESDRGEP